MFRGSLLTSGSKVLLCGKLNEKSSVTLTKAFKEWHLSMLATAVNHLEFEMLILPAEFSM